MVSVERCKQLLGEDCLLSDAEVVRLRDGLHAMASFAIEALACREPAIRKERIRIVSEPALEAVLNDYPEDVRVDAIERAAIMEFDGGMPRAEAERRVLATVLALAPARRREVLS